MYESKKNKKLESKPLLFFCGTEAEEVEDEDEDL